MSKKLIELILPSIEKTSALIKREYLELQFLQNSPKKDQFAQVALAKIKDKLLDSLSPFKNFDCMFTQHIKTNKCLPSSCIAIDLIDSYDNFLNAIPYFATSIFIKRTHPLSKKCHYASITLFPALNSIIYTTTNQGVFISESNKIEKIAFTASSKKNIESCFAWSAENVDNTKLQNLTEHNNANINSMRIFNSLMFSVKLVLQKKLAQTFLFHTNYIQTQIVQLLCKESRLTYKIDKEKNFICPHH